MRSLRELLPHWRKPRLGSWLAWGLLWIVAIATLWPLFFDLQTYGFHDWDVMTAHRALVVQSITDGEFPGFNKYACGGFPAWGYVEGGTVLASPLLPIYMLFDLRVALRLEVVFFALLGHAGVYVAAGRLTASPGARALAAVLWATNGRFALQAASGHTWHLVYALLPWGFYFFERARKRPHRSWPLLGLSGCFALGVYWGGIYPLPHMVLSLGVYAACLSVLGRSVRPLLTLGATGVCGVLLAAPKLLPILATFERAPRLIESTETLSVPALLAMLTSRQQGFFDRPAEVSPYGFHEWGIYVSAAGAFLLLLGMLLTRGRRALSLLVVTWLLGLLGFGAFAPYAPWTLLHEHVPLFRSQHVPSRFLYPAVMFGGLVLCAGLGRALLRLGRARPGAEWGLLALAAIVGFDVASVARKPLAEAMVLVAGEPRPSPNFVQERKARSRYLNPDWAMPLYLPMRDNHGVIECYGVPAFEPKGALPRRHPLYRGENFRPDGGEVRVLRETTQSRSLQLGGEAGKLVVNLNYDAGFFAELSGSYGRITERAVVDRGRVAFDVPAGTERCEVRYRPPGLGVGGGVMAVTLLSLAGLGIFRGLRARKISDAR